MFEHIYFLNSQVNVGTHDLLQLAKYDKMVKEYRLAENVDFHMEGKSQYMLQRPLSSEKQKNLMYLQAFVYMDSGSAYFTKRKDYASYLLLYTYEGTGELIYRNQHYSLREGDGFLIDCTEEHYYRTVGAHWCHSDLHFYGGLSNYFYRENFAAKYPVFHCAKTNAYQNQLEKILRMQNDMTADRDFRFSFELEKLLFYVLDCLSEADQEDAIPDNIRMLQNYLEQHFIQNISLEYMADFSGISKYYLCRQFKKHTGFSPKEYVIHLRLLHAQMLLQSTDIPCYKIGIISGFPNEANFIQHFKKENGMTPGEYRNKSR